MARRAPRRNVKKTRSLETLESRVVMSADPLLSLHGSLIDDEPVMTTHSAPAMTTHVTPGYDPNADFWVGGGLLDGELDDLGQRIEQTLYEANQQTGQNQMLAKYGFTGTGQTVAVIDTGIAYTHYALGGGVGSGYKVVGGWDFTENDANFYDDQGPKAAHGTHVAGIIGAEGDGIHSGVSTGVDLVGLRVFDDAGNGYFHWVEQALQWVYNNRNSYANPITTVNLSLGTEWNSLSNPTWAMLENEFAQLESVGIFISVSAGNSFTNYNTKGLSYPAASDHVIPVMATDGNGQLSYFSQRADGAIAAPGRYITSTVPDYAANDADTIDDDWLSMSGTSMAAPYVAGASTLIRQAMQFVGQTGIDQWDIYNHMMATADTFYDSATATNYKRLNLAAAIDALMPLDDFGSSQIDAYNLGTLNDSGATPLASLSGVISTLDDADCFKFVAGASGTVTIGATQSHELTAQWQVWGASSWTVNQAGECVIDVVAGQTYTFSIATSDGLGYYDLSVELESNFAAIEWGSIGTQETRAGLSVNGETWYQVTAGRTGYFTAETIAQSGSASVAIYSAQMGALTTASDRAEFQATAGQTFYLRVTGSSANFNLRMTNALTVSGGVASLLGTAGNDAISFTAGSGEHTVSLNGVSYSVSATNLSLAGGGGDDAVVLRGGSGVETASLQGASATLTGVNYSATATAFAHAEVVLGAEDSADLLDSSGDDSVTGWADRVVMTLSDGKTLTARGASTNRVYSSTGYDKAVLHGTAGNDTFTSRPDKATMSAGGVSNTVYGFDLVYGYAGGGFDTAKVYDSNGDDIFDAYSTRSVMRGAGYRNEQYGFDETLAYSSGGFDISYMYDSAGADTYRSHSDRVYMYGDGYLNYAANFDETWGYSTTGDDTAIFYDTAGDDEFRGYKDRSFMFGNGFLNYAANFERAYAYATTGNDIAKFYDTPGAEEFRGYHDRALMISGSHINYATGFDQNLAYSTGGNDTAKFYDSAGNDEFRGYSDRSTMFGQGYLNYAAGFRWSYAYATTGADVAKFYDSAGDDEFRGYSDRATMFGPSYLNYAANFDQAYAYASSGNDIARFYDSAGNDEFRGYSDRAMMIGAGFLNYASKFDKTIAYSTSGYDLARFWDSAGDDLLVAGASSATMSGSSYNNTANGFDRVAAFASLGNDRAKLSDTASNDQLTASGNMAKLVGGGIALEAYDFDDIEATSQNGGVDELAVGATDFAFEQIGNWS